MNKRYAALLLALALIFALAGCGAEAGPDYSGAENWAYLETDKTAAADVFFICPTVYGGGEGGENMPLSDGEARESFLGATNMEKGIYDAESRFFAPYYRQAGLSVYELPVEEREPISRWPMRTCARPSTTIWSTATRGGPSSSRASPRARTCACVFSRTALPTRRWTACSWPATP